MLSVGTALWETLEGFVREGEPVIRVLAEKVDCNFDADKTIGVMREIISRQNRPFKLGIIGEFNAGKSSLINVLTERKIAYVDDMEATASLNCYKYGDEDKATVIYTDGRQEHIPRVDLNQWLDENRHDAELLSQIDFVRFCADSTWLKRMEIWDTPGLGGSKFHTELAKRFIREVDAVIWVFDCNYLGQSALGDALQELRDRGKPILAVVNKCEDRTADQIPRVVQNVERAYPSVTFQQIIPFSAFMAQDFLDGTPESSFFGDLEADGGIGQLREALEKEILNNPAQISAAAAAGDLRALIMSAADSAHRIALEAGRKLWLVDDQVEKSETAIQSTLSKLSEEFDDELIIGLREHIISNMDGRLRKATVSNILNPQWLKDQLNKLYEGDLTDFSIDFISAREGRVIAAVEQMISDRTHDLYKNLVPGEVGRFFKDATIENFKIQSTGREFIGVVSPNALLSPQIKLALVIHTWNWLFRIISGRSQSSDSSEEYIRSNTVRIIRQAITGSTEEQRQILAETIGKIVNDTKADVHSIVFQSIETRILNGVPRSDVEIISENARNTSVSLTKIGNDIARAAGLASENKAAILRTSSVISTGERGRSLEIIQAILAESSDHVQITDGNLDDRALLFLKTANDSAPIGIVAWKQPVTGGIAEVFSEALHKLQANRSGSVSVVCPKPKVELTKELRPAHCWFFTACGTYEFDATLSDVINSTRTIKFTNHDDHGDLQKEMFQRWWDDDVKDYQAVSII